MLIDFSKADLTNQLSLEVVIGVDQLTDVHLRILRDHNKFKRVYPLSSHYLIEQLAVCNFLVVQDHKLAVLVANKHEL